MIDDQVRSGAPEASKSLRRLTDDGVFAWRLRVFDLDGDLAAAGRDIAAAIAGREAEVVGAFWSHYLRATPPKAHPTAPDKARLTIEFIRLMQVMLTDLHNSAWVAGMGAYRQIAVDQLSDLTVLRAALAAQYGYVAKLALRREGGGPPGRPPLDEVFRFGALSACILSNHYQDARMQKHADERDRQAHLFRDCIEAGVVHASELGRELRGRAVGASKATRGTLTKTSQVAAASQQSARAMAGAAETVAGLVQVIEEAQGEIDLAVDTATRVSGQLSEAVRIAQTLAETASTVDTILQLIRKVAIQSKMLSFNAAIEASRAGDAGRGFALVAQEIKALAAQSAEAVDEIAEKMAAIQDATRTTVAANSAIRDSVAEVQSSVTRIRSAIGLQAETAGTIMSAVDETATTAGTMSVTISTIRADTEDVTREIDALEGAFDRLNGKLAELQGAARDYIGAA